MSSDNKVAPSELSKADDVQKSDAIANDEAADPVVRVYGKRWTVLLAFVLLSCSNATQYLEYASVADKSADFYGVSLTAVNWLAMCRELTYLILIIPSNMIIDRFGLYVCVLLGAVLNCIAGWLKIASAAPWMYWLALSGSTLAAVAEMPILGVPSLLAATWFSWSEGVQQVGTATAIGVFGNQVGAGLGFLIPPLLVSNSSVCAFENASYSDNCTYEVTRASMLNLGYFNAAFTTLALFVVILLFRDRPPLPPSAAQAAAKDSEVRDSFLYVMKTLFTHRGFILLFISYGIMAGCYYSYSTLLNSIVLKFSVYEYRHCDLAIQGIQNSQSIGALGLTMTLAGVVGAIIVGPILDKTAKYKLVTIVFFVITVLSFGISIACLHSGKMWTLFIANVLIGFFMTGYLPIGFEFAAEITYPISENTTAGLLNASGQIVGLILTSVGQALLDSRLGADGCVVMFACFVLVATVVSLFIPEILVRHAADADREYRRRATTLEPSRSSTVTSKTGRAATLEALRRRSTVTSDSKRPAANSAA